MTYEDIKRNIGKRLGDPDLDIYRGLVGDMFVNAMCDLLMEDKYQPEDIPDLLVDTEPVDEDGDSVDVAFVNWEGSWELPRDTLKFLDVYLSTADLMTTQLTLKEVDHEEIKRIQLEPAFAPTHTECFWYRKGASIKFVLSKDFKPSESPASFPFVFSYIKNPNPDDWTTAIDLISNKGYSRDFLYTAINGAVNMLKGSELRVAE